MPLIKFTTVHIAQQLPPKVDQQFLTTEEWNVWTQTALKLVQNVPMQVKCLPDSIKSV